MKNIYSIFGLLLVLISISVSAQTKIYAPTLRMPENMAVEQMPNALLDWDAVTGISPVIEYEVQIANNPDFTDAVTFDRTEFTALEMTDLVFGFTYYWHVKAYDGDQGSAWSETWSFSVISAVIMDKPNEGAEVFANPLISWEALTGIDGYIMEIDTTYEWVVDESGITDDLNATVVVGENNIWAVGEGGIVLHNDGTGWITVDAGITEDLHGISYVDATNMYVVGGGGIVGFFDGSAWTTIDIGTSSNLTAVDFTDINNGVIVGEGGVIFQYNSGVWTELESGDSNDLFDVNILDPDNIWACGDNDIVVHYLAGEWTVEEVGNREHYTIYMADANTGWVGSGSGKIYRWNGIEWFEEGSPTNDDIFAMDFNGMTGYAACEGGTLLQFEGAWKQITSGLEDDLFGVSVNNEGGCVVGAGGTILNQANSGFNSPLLTTYDVPADSGSWELYNLLFGQTYYYRIKAFHGSDTTAWSGVKFITTQASPMLTNPSDGSTTDLYVKFSWEEYEGTTNYIFHVDDDESFDQPRSFAPNSDTLWVGDLLFGTQYYWRVAAQHSQDISEWSDVWTFTTVHDVTQISPANGATEINRCPLFTWEAVAGTSGYELWVDKDDSFSNPSKYVGASPSYQCQSNLEMNTLYYWKVRGISGPLFSDWSETWSFRTEQGIGIDENQIIESASVYPNPANGEFNVNVTVKAASNFNMSLVDLTGAFIMEQSVELMTGENIIPVNVPNLKSGTYTLLLSNDSDKIVKRVVIK